MLKAIFYKEWIKTRWYILLAALLSLGFSLFSLFRISRILALKGGTQHLWEVMLQKDTVFVELLEYIPLLVGLVFAIVQFVPEIHHKCLKLTLHLPYSQQKMTLSMLFYGFIVLFLCFLVNYTLLYFFFSSYFASELVSIIFTTLTPWFLAGFAAYLFTAWICLEPTWRYRITNSIIAVLLLRIFFLSSTPGAYVTFTPYLVIFVILLFPLSWLSIKRFKEGKQD